jgi:CxxC motif-containing protein (DUF1111 family)
VKAAGRALVLLTALNALGATGSCPPPQPGDPLRGLTASELDRFHRGKAVFERKFTPETGLGPLFNGDACGECHEDPATGGAGDEVEDHVAVMGANGVCNQLEDRGGPVFQQHVTPALHDALGIDREPLPPGVVVAARTAPDLFGFGLLDAVPDRVILALADPDDRNHDGVSGRPNFFVDGRLGRFGRKAFVPTLAEFNHGAFVIEQGVTSPAIPTEETVGGAPLPPGVDPVADPELSQEDMDLADDFVRFLAPPARLPLDAQAEQGRLTFAGIGCVSCHVPSLSTNGNAVGALSYKSVEAYTDLLLHDMGAARGDICMGQALPGEFRTEPLMGLHLMQHYLHDGKAKTIDEAILLHAGEATRARERYQRLSPEARAALLKFLKSL